MSNDIIWVKFMDELGNAHFESIETTIKGKKQLDWIGFYKSEKMELKN
jgi:hypothetical protein